MSRTYEIIASESVTLGIQQSREQLRDRVDAALEDGEHTVITRNGRPVAALIPHWWLEELERLEMIEARARNLLLPGVPSTAARTARLILSE